MTRLPSQPTDASRIFQPGSRVFYPKVVAIFRSAYILEGRLASTSRRRLQLRVELQPRRDAAQFVSCRYDVTNPNKHNIRFEFTAIKHLFNRLASLSHFNEIKIVYLESLYVR